MSTTLTFLAWRRAVQHHRFGSLAIQMILILVLSALTAPAADALVEPWKQQWNTRLTNVLGPLDFAREGLIPYSLSRIHPQTEDAFKAFADEKLSTNVATEHQQWLGRVFKGAFLRAATNLQPAKYYVNEGRAEPSLLLYKMEFERNQITLLESYEAFVLMIKPPNFDSTHTIDRALVGRVLFEWINLRKRQAAPPQPAWVPGSKDVPLGHVENSNPYTIPFDSPEEILDSFRVPAQPRIGSIFRNLPAYNSSTILIFWQANITGFVGNHGLCFILYKVDRPGDPRLDFPYDYNWLNKALFREDGKTLVDPPKNERTNDPYNRGRAL